MMKPVLTVTVVLLLAVTGSLCNDLCEHPEEIKTVEIDMDKLTDRRLNFIYVLEKSQQTVFTDHMYMDLFKSCDSSYTGLFTLAVDNLGFSLVKRFNITVDDKGVLNVVMHARNKPTPSDFKWYVLEKADDGAMLVYRCDVGKKNDFDKRYIMVPSGRPYFSDRVVQRVSSSLITTTSVNRLLDVDRSYNFTGKLERLPYALQEHYNS